MSRREFLILVQAYKPRRGEKAEVQVPAFTTDIPGLVLTPALYENTYGNPRAELDAFHKDGKCNLTHHRSGLKVAGPFNSFIEARSFATRIRGVRWEYDFEDIDHEEAKVLVEEARRSRTFAIEDGDATRSVGL